MVSHLKIQLNLYSHREQDNLIINNLGLNEISNVNLKVKEILSSVANGSSITLSDEPSKNKIAELEIIIKNLKAENSMLKKNQFAPTPQNELLISNIIQNPTELPTEPKKINNKLLGSIQSLEI